MVAILTKFSRVGKRSAAHVAKDQRDNLALLLRACRCNCRRACPFTHADGEKAKIGMWIVVSDLWSRML